MRPLMLASCCEGAVMLSWMVAGAVLPPVVPPFAVAWHLNGHARGSPAVSGGTVYFLSKHHDLMAIERESGRLVWTRPTGEAGPSTTGSRVVATDEIVIAGDHNLVAFDRAGVQRWRFAPSDGYGPGPYLGEVGRELVFAGSPAGRVVGVELATGAARWDTRVTGGDDTVVFAPVVSGDLVVVGIGAGADGPGGVVALDASTGRARWRAAFGWDAHGPVGFGGGLLVVERTLLVADTSGRIHVLDRATGRFIRSWPAPAAPVDGAFLAQDYRPLTRAGPVVVAGSLSGTVVAYDLPTGRERWRRTPWPASVAFGLTSDAQAVYVPYLSGPLVALDIGDGRERGRTATRTGEFSWVPAADAPLLFAASSTDGFFAFRMP